MSDEEWSAPGGDAPETLSAGSYYSDEAATLGDRIAAARQAAGLKQQELASRLGVGAKVVSSWENDRAEPRANRLQMLAGMLNVSVAWLLTGGGDGVPPPEERAGAHGPLKPFSLTILVDDLVAARRFYSDALGCAPLAEAEGAQTFDFFGHHVRFVQASDAGAATAQFGVELDWPHWRQLVDRLRAQVADFIDEPVIEGVGGPEERGAFRLRDPAGNVVAFTTRREGEVGADAA